MYETFYGLSELPFELTANPKFLYLSAGQREALSTLQYGLFAAKALTLLIGCSDAGDPNGSDGALPTLTDPGFYPLLSTQAAGGFTGVHIGLHATGPGGNWADFDSFTYRSLDG